MFLEQPVPARTKRRQRSLPVCEYDVVHLVSARTQAISLVAALEVIWEITEMREKFDPQGDYVKRWVPELKNLSPKFIHQPWNASSEELQMAGVELGKNYPRPIVDHVQARNGALAALKMCNASRGSAT